MNWTAGPRLGEYLRRLCNGLVLLLLVALGVWGHGHHWQIPRFSELTGPGHASDPRHPRAGGALLEKSRSGREADHGTSERGAIEAPRPDAGGPHAPLNQPLEPGDGRNLPAIRFRSPEAAKKAGIRTETAQVKELDEYITANGVVGYDETRLAQLSARVPGIAWRVEKQVGDHVHKGEILAILDSLDVGKAKAEYLEAVVAFELKSENLKRLEKISSSIPERQIREAQASAREARIRWFNAQQKLINFGLPMTSRFSTGLSDEELRTKIQFLGIPPETVAGLDPDAATGNLIPLAAPFDGVVIDREIVSGEVVQTGHTQFVIADVSRVWLKLNVRKTDAIRLEIGQEILFTSDGIPGEVECKLAWIGTEVDEKTRTIQVRGEADNPLVGTKTEAEGGQRLLRTHTFGTARIRVREDRRTVMVPSSAIQWDGRRHLVFVPLSDGRGFQPRAVALGVSREGQTEIVQGIAPGEAVVSAGSYVLKSEMGREQTATRP